MDSRTYIRLHDGMPDHPKVVGLSDGAFRLYIELLCWCSRHLTDGVVPSAVMVKLGKPKTIKELGAAGLIRTNDPGPGWHIHDYLAHQRSAADVNAAREQRRVAGRAGGLAKAQRVAKQTSSESLDNVESLFDNEGHGSDSHSHPDRVDEKGAPENSSRPATSANGLTEASEPLDDSLSGGLAKGKQETETEKEKDKIAPPGPQRGKSGSRRSSDSPEFTTFWEIYPRKVGKAEARKAWDKAIKAGTMPSQIIDGAKAYVRDPIRRTSEIKFTAHPATWLNQARWDDEPPALDNVIGGGWWNN